MIRTTIIIDSQTLAGIDAGLAAFQERRTKGVLADVHWLTERECLRFSICPKFPETNMPAIAEAACDESGEP